MRIRDLLDKKSIALGAHAKNKREAIDQAVALIDKSGAIGDIYKYTDAVLAREKEGSTGIGEGVAIPHAKTDAVKRPALAAMVLPDGVDYESLDGEPAKLLFLIAAPNTEDNVHLDVLSCLSVLLMDDDFRAKLMKAKTADAFLDAIDQAEHARDAQEQAAKNADASGRAGEYRVLAVTGCPTGIAHTYMAAENLENAGKELGVSIKVETDGSGGVKNELTRAEIAACDAVIVASDREIEMARFEGKKVLITGVASGISKPKELIERALKGNVPIYHHSKEDGFAPSGSDEHESVGRKIYKQLMNGVSHMLPFVTGGGILIALAFLFDSANAGTDIFGSGNPFSAFLKGTGDVAFSMMMPILAGFIAMAIGDRPGLALGIVGGLLATSSGSGFFGALIAGFVAGYIIVLLRWVFGKLPKALEGTKPVLLYPLVGLLLMGAVMTYIVNPPMAAFNGWLSNALASMGEVSKVLLGVVLGGMMAIDFGGPFNKAAYVFGVASIATGNFDIMAAVMIGGMVPPIAIALATTFFRNRFTKSERSTTITNYIMGLSFITEGAIPFAAADPLRVIPSCIVGSAVAGGLSMLFGCASRAPHGGIFVIGIIDNPLMYVLSLVIGALVSMVLLALLKKPIPAERQDA